MQCWCIVRISVALVSGSHITHSQMTSNNKCWRQSLVASSKKPRGIICALWSFDTLWNDQTSAILSYNKIMWCKIENVCHNPRNCYIWLQIKVLSFWQRLLEMPYHSSTGKTTCIQCTALHCSVGTLGSVVTEVFHLPPKEPSVPWREDICCVCSAAKTASFLVWGRQLLSGWLVKQVGQSLSEAIYDNDLGWL